MAGARLGGFLGGPVRDTQTPSMILAQSADAMGIAQALGSVGAGISRRRDREDRKAELEKQRQIRAEERASDRAFALDREQRQREFTLQRDKARAGQEKARDKDRNDFTLKRDEAGRKFRRELVGAEHAKDLLGILAQNAKKLESLEQIQRVVQERGGNIDQLTAEIAKLRRGSPGLSARLMNMAKAGDISPASLQEDPSTLFTLSAEVETGIENAKEELRQARKSGDQATLGKASENLSRLRASQSSLEARMATFKDGQRQKAGQIVKTIKTVKNFDTFMRYAQSLDIPKERLAGLGRAVLEGGMTPNGAMETAERMARAAQEEAAETQQREQAVSQLTERAKRLGLELPDDVSEAVMSGNTSFESAATKLDQEARLLRAERNVKPGDDSGAQAAKDTRTILTEMRRRDKDPTGMKSQRIEDPFFGMSPARLAAVISLGGLGPDAEAQVFGEIERALGRQLSEHERRAMKQRDPTIFGQESKDAER